MVGRSLKIKVRKKIAPYLYDKYNCSLIKSMIVKQYGVALLIKLPSGLYTVMHEVALGNPEVEIYYKFEMAEKMPNRFISKLEAKAYILDMVSGKNNDFCWM